MPLPTSEIHVERVQEPGPERHRVSPTVDCEPLLAGLHHHLHELMRTDLPIAEDAVNRSRTSTEKIEPPASLRIDGQILTPASLSYWKYESERQKQMGVCSTVHWDVFERDLINKNPQPVVFIGLRQD